MTFTGKCINYQGCIKPDGYGDRYSKISKHSRNAHRVYYEEVHGKIPRGMVVMHKCDNRRCVNLEHLQLGTYKENMQDMHNKKRWCDRKGDKHPLAKFSNQQITEIKQKYALGYTQGFLAKEYSTDQGSISRFINNIRYKIL